MLMSAGGISTDRFLHSATLVQTNKYLAVLGGVILVYDYLQTLELEVGFIWKAKWDLGKIIFLLARYPTFAVTSAFIYIIAAPEISSNVFYTLSCFIFLVGAFVVAAAEVTLIMRTFALSGSNRWILGIISSVYAGGTISGFVIVAKLMFPPTCGNPSITTPGQCPTSSNSLGIVTFGLILAFEVLIFLITLVIGIRRFRHTQSRLVVSLYTDGIFYFIYIVLVSSVNIIIQAIGPFELLGSLSTLQIVAHSVLACRIVLHVRRETSSRRCDEETTTIAPIQFTRRESAMLQGTLNPT